MLLIRSTVYAIVQVDHDTPTGSHETFSGIADDLVALDRRAGSLIHIHTPTQHGVVVKDQVLPAIVPAAFFTNIPPPQMLVLSSI